MFLADMLLHMVSNKVAGMVFDMGAGMVANMGVKKLFLACMELADKEVDKVADMVAGHGCWLIGPKLFRPEPLITDLRVF